MDNEAYKVLYRKFRPKTFSDVYGQSNVVKTLKNELKANRISHAYLFTGSRGTGKTTCAKILAKAVNCLDLDNGEPCGKCEACIGIEKGIILDIVEIDAASNNGVDNIRELREEISFMPSVAKYRVYIIDEVHMLSIGAFNALLKTLEEPPPHVIFILATTEVHKLPVTILSRCQRFDFSRISIDDIVARLKDVSNLEGVDLEDRAAYLIAKLSDGALRDALSLLDRCIVEGNRIDVNVVNEATGSVGISNIFDIVDNILESKPKEAIDIINKLYVLSKNMSKLCSEIIEHCRNLMIVKTSEQSRSLILLSDEDYDRLKDQSKRVSIDKVIYIINTLSETIDRMTNSAISKIELETSIVKLCVQSSDDLYSTLVARIERLEKSIENATIKEKTNNNKGIKSPAIEKRLDSLDIGKEQVQLSFNNISNICDGAVFMENWSDVLEALKKISNTIYTAFKNSEAYINGDYILIKSDIPIAFELLKKSSQRDKMRSAIKEVTGRVYKLGPYKKDSKSDDSYKDPLETLKEIALKSGINVN